MALDLNVSPFFDDHSEDKQFYRILFRPGYAVQARELTQLQTLIQQQIKRHGDHIFKQGSMVIPGQISYDTDVYYAQLTDYAGIDVFLNSILNKEIKNELGLIAEVITFTLAEDSDSPTIFFKYKNSVIDPTTTNNISEFSVNDVLTAVDTNILGSITIPEPTGFVATIGKSSTATIKKGVYYINDNFVLVEDQVVILDKYDNSPSYKVGLQLVEDIIYPEDDESLLDNALGSPNYAAPGAARYYMNLVLTKASLTSQDPENFIELLRLESGKVVFKIDRSQYAELEKTLARRTYDESGDYALSPFNIRARNYRNNLRGDWAASEKFIQGDIIRTTIGNSFSLYYFVCTIAGESNTQKPTFSTDPVAGYITDGTVRWEYTVLPQFNKGVYTFIAGDSAYSNFTLADHQRLDGMLAYGIEAGKAYVRGYEIEKLGTEYIAAPKSRYLPAASAALATYLNTPSFQKNEFGGLDEVELSLSQTKTQNIDTSMGSYVLVKNAVYAPDVTGLSEVGLFDDTIANAGIANIIGTARVRGMEFHSTGVYKLFLFDIKLQADGLIDNVKAIGNINGLSESTFKCDMDLAVDEKLTIKDPLNTSLVYPLADYAIQDIVSMDYIVVGTFSVSTGTGTSITLSASSGYTFEPGSVPSNYIIIAASGVDAGDYITNATFGSSGTNSMTISNLTTGISYTVFATLKRSNALTPHAAVQVVDQTDTFTIAANAQLTEITLSKAYVSRIVSIKMSSAGFGESTSYDTDITSRYLFKANSSLSAINKGSIVLEDGAPLPIGPIQVKYEYINVTASTPGDILNVESYTASLSAIRYEEIFSVGGVSLRDSIDFRPVQGVSSYNTRYFPKFGETTTVQYRNNLSRIDLLSMSSTGKYLLSLGNPSANPREPNAPQEAMKLARISLEPYTFNIDNNSVDINRTENKRYTMRDIGKLERRISDLEYYTSLSLLESDTKNLKIVDSNGLERFQNGFIVDRFDGQGVGNASSAEWNASIDSNNKELRPFFNQRQLELLENADKENKEYVINGDLVTFPYSEVSMIEQTKASQREFVNPYALYAYIGIVGLTPWSDTWFSTERRPDVIINDEGQYNAVVAKAEEEGVLGTIWNAWAILGSSVKSLEERKDVLDRWSQSNTTIMNDQNNGGSFWRARSTFTTDELEAIGVDPALAGNQGALGGIRGGIPGLRVLTIETSAVETQSAREGVRSFIVDKVDSRVIDDRVLETRVVPYIRPRTVLVRGFGFRSNTKMYSFFDGSSVDGYVECATRIKYTKISGKHDTFITNRNCGSNVENVERLVTNATGVFITGTVSVNNGETTVTGYTTSFTSEISAGDTVFFNTTDRGYMVASVTDNLTLTLKDTYEGADTSQTALSVLSKKFSNSTVEIAFSHGEVVKEYTSNGDFTGRSFIVVGQEVNAGDLYLWVLNEKGDKTYKTTGGHYLEGEYTDLGSKPRITFAQRTAFNYLASSATGQVNGIFRIPNNPIDRFRTGTRSFKLTDSPTNSLDSTTQGTTVYEANGIIEVKQRTILSTRTAEIASEVLSDSQTIVNTNDRIVDDSGWFDPLAQTFLVQQAGGCYITSVDLWFAAVEPTGKIPVRVEIREVVNGYPGKYVLPFSRVEKAPAAITIDALSGTVATNFKFESPVYLQDGVEYALVVLSDSNAYEIWISETLKKDIITGNVINSQPYNGVMFKSQNASTWTADQTQDMKFRINRAEFSKTSAIVDFITPTLKPKELAFNPFNFVESGIEFRVEHRNHGFKDANKVIFKSRQIVTFVNGIPAPYIFDTELPVDNVELDMYRVNLYATLPNANNALTPATGSKSFTMVSFDSTKFAAFRAGTTVIRFTAYNTDTKTVYSDSYMEGTVTSVNNTTIVINVTKTGSDTTTQYSNWILSSTSSGKVGGSYISATENYEYQTISMVGSTNVLPETDIKFEFLGITRENAAAEVNREIALRENYNLDQEMVLPHSSNYSSSTNTAGFPMRVRATLSSNSTNLSPSLDLHGIAMTLINNKIDSPTVDVNDSALDYIKLVANKTLEADTDFAIVEVGDNAAIRVVLTDTVTVTELNKLKIGAVIKVDYAGTTANSYHAVADKYTDGTYAYYVMIPETSSPVLYNSGGVVDITWMSHYVNEIAPFGGSVTSKYISKKINFSRPSDMAQIMFAAQLPVGADVDVYIKTGSSASGDFDARSFTKVNPTSGYVKNDSQFTDITYKIEGLDTFDSIMVKLVMRSTDKAKVPRIKDLRIISCAA